MKKKDISDIEQKQRTYKRLIGYWDGNGARRDNNNNKISGLINLLAETVMIMKEKEIEKEILERN